MDLSGILIDFDIGVWASIFSNLEISDINEFEQIPEYFYVLANKTFWIELIRQRFPEYYAPLASGYVWKDIYLSLLRFVDDYQDKYQEYIADVNTTKDWVYSSLNANLKLKKYLLFNNLLKITSADIIYLLERSDKETIEYLFNKYSPNQSELSFIFGYALGAENSKVLKYLLSYKHSINGDVVELSKNDLANIVVTLRLLNIDLSGEELESIYDRLYSNEPGYDDLYNKLEFMLHQSHYLLSKDDVNYMLRKYSKKLNDENISDRDIWVFLGDAIRGNHYQLFNEVYTRSKHRLSLNEINILTKSAKKEWSEDLSEVLDYNDDDLYANVLNSLSLEKMLDILTKVE